jgi:entericidin B
MERRHGTKTRKTAGVNMTQTMKMFLALMALGTVVACETVQGAGRDLSNAGDTITEESQEVQEEL